MTHDTPPKRIWADPPETFDGMDVWRSEPGGRGVEYILASEHAALIREAEARGWNNGMLTATSIVAEERNKRNPGPLFEVLNKAIGKIEDTRFAAIRERKQ